MQGLLGRMDGRAVSMPRGTAMCGLVMCVVLGVGINLRYFSTYHLMPTLVQYNQWYEGGLPRGGDGSDPTTGTEEGLRLP